MTEPTDRHREIATKIVVNYIDRGANERDVRRIAGWLAAARTEDRAEFARLAQSEEMVERITRQASYVPSDLSRGIVRDILAALFRETGVSP